MHRLESMHMIREGQVRWLAKGDVLGQRAFVRSLASPRKKPLSICMAFCATSPPFATDPSGFRFGP
jgi:hypothetical protein